MKVVHVNWCGPYFHSSNDCFIKIFTQVNCPCSEQRMYRIFPLLFKLIKLLSSFVICEIKGCHGSLFI